MPGCGGRFDGRVSSLGDWRDSSPGNVQKSGLREAQTSGRRPPLSAGRLRESSARSSRWLPRTQCLEAAARPGPLPRGWWRLRHRRFPPPAPASTEGRSMARQPVPNSSSSPDSREAHPKAENLPPRAGCSLALLLPVRGSFETVGGVRES